MSQESQTLLSFARKCNSNSAAVRTRAVVSVRPTSVNIYVARRDRISYINLHEVTAPPPLNTLSSRAPAAAAPWMANASASRLIDSPSVQSRGVSLATACAIMTSVRLTLAVRCGSLLQRQVHNRLQAREG